MRSAQERAARLLELLDAGELVFDGRRIDRAWMLETLEAAQSLHAGDRREHFAEELLLCLESAAPLSTPAERARLVEGAAEFIAALMQRLRS